MMPLQQPFLVSMIVPTGIGAHVGGFGGDATQAMNLLASVCDGLITHPNVANAAMFQQLPENTLYVEGYGLDRFFAGDWALRPVRANRIGIVYDAGMDPRLLTLHRNIVNAVRTVYGVAVVAEAVTNAPLEIACTIANGGASSGALKNPAVLLEAAQCLIEQGCTALALCLYLPEVAEAGKKLEADYRQGQGVDPIGGVEAILSHLVVSEFGLPCAHAPVFDFETSQPEWEAVVDPRAASEYIASSFLPCVLTGLQRAPSFVHPAKMLQDGDIRLSQLGAVVVPADALGGLPVLSAISHDIPVIAVAENTTVMSVEAEAYAGAGHIIPAQSYLEAAGILQALKHGFSLDALRGNVRPLL